MAALAPVTEFAVADSRFNEGELRDAGYPATATASLLVDLESFDGEADPRLAQQLADDRARGGADFLFVGKVSPHKGQHDLVKALAAYRRLYDPRARLRIVGGAISEDYQSAVERFAKELGLGEAVDFAGSVTHEELIAYYDAADAFLCLSHHEGFCVPLIEAMHHRLPIVAHATTAVPETVADAGIMLPDKDPVRVAAALDRVVRDTALREMLGRAAAGREATFSLPRARAVYAA
ncbi:MAG: glycosyltransferase family 4 protein, partial [Acidimicrobiales bacterium]|nr:glycosyltransferase family 4 protein [Acidimicrobiales bacterium]